MHDELKEEGIVNKVGGRFKLSTLIQKRLIALNTGAKPLVDLRGGDKMAIVIQEILQDQIYLYSSRRARSGGVVWAAGAAGDLRVRPGGDVVPAGPAGRAVRLRHPVLRLVPAPGGAGPPGRAPRRQDAAGPDARSPGGLRGGRAAGP